MDARLGHVDASDNNWSRAFDFMNAHPDPVVRSMLRLAYGQFVRDGLDGVGRPEDFDLLYCFQLLARAFSHKEAVANAVEGRFDE